MAFSCILVLVKLYGCASKFDLLNDKFVVLVYIVKYNGRSDVMS